MPTFDTALRSMQADCLSLRIRLRAPARATVALAFAAFASTAHADPMVKLLTFQDTPDPVASTTQLTYQLQVSNTDFTNSAAGVALSVPLPAGVTFISVDDPACSFSSPNVVCSFGTVPASTNKIVNIVLRVTAAGGSTLNSTAVASSTSPGESNSSILQTTSVIAGADLQLTMSGSPNPVTAGGQVTYQLISTNLGPDASSSLSIVNTLPPNVSYSSASGTNWSCSAAGSTVTCNRTGSLANGASSTLNIVATVNSSTNGTITNAATVSAATADGIPNNNTTTTDVTVVAGANLSITKNVSPSPVIESGATTFTLSPRNTSGPDAAASVTVTDILPNGFTSIGASGTNWSCSVDQPTRTVTCTRATMPVGATNNIVITATAPDSTIVPAAGMSSSNTATITATTADPALANNTGSVNFNIQRDGADMSITKSRPSYPIAQGSPITSVITARNNGPRALTAGSTITIVDTLPAGEDYSGAASFTNNGWSCTFAAPDFTCTRTGALAINTNAPTLTLTTTATGAGSLTNSACVGLSGAILDPNSANNCVSAGVNSTAAIADIAIVKSQNINPVTTSDTSIQYTLTITNNGPDDSTSVVVSDVIPMRTTLAGTTVINAVAGVGDKGSTGSCGVSAATVTCNYANLLYASAGTGAINTAETAVITVTVNRPMLDGSFTNTATINSTAIGDSNRSNNTSSVSTTVDPVADITVQSKTVTPNPVLAGVDATYVITVRNNGPSQALGVVLEDQFNPTPGDTGYSIQSMTASQGSCSFNSGSDLVTCNIGTMAANNVQTVTIVARPKWMASPPIGRNLQNTATASMTTADSNGTNNSQSATLNINAAQVDLIGNITDVASFVGVSPDPLGYDGITPANNLVTYRVNVTNSGPSEATGVTFQNSYTPANGKSVTFLCDSTSQYSCTGVAVCAVNGGATTTGPTPQVVDCTAPSLNASGSYARYLRYQINDAPAALGDTYSNAVTVASNETDSNGANNSATEPTAVRAKADLEVTSKTAIVASPPLQFGQVFQWSILVTNNGPGTAYTSALTDTLPANMELVLPLNYSVSGGGTCSNTGVTQISCDLGTIAALGTQTVVFDAIAKKPASPPYPTSYNNTASVTTFSVDQVSANNSNSGSVNLVKSSIAGRVYRDHNNNATIDGGENGISGVSLTLTGNDFVGTAVNRTVSSDGSGNFLFDNLEQSNGAGYTITESQPSGYSDGLETVGTAATGVAPGGTVSATVGSNTITSIVLDKDQVATGYNFGELRLNTLGGTVFADVNNDGTKQGGEPGILNVTITLSGTDARGNAVNTTATTNASGVYSFTNVLPGSYQLDETHPITYVDGIDTVGSLGGSNAVNDRFSGLTLTDTNGTGYNLGELPATLSGRVWRDIDRDGVLDAGEVGIASVTITLSGTDTLGAAVSRSTTTNGTGNFSFVDLPSGTFQVVETQPTGFGSSTPNTISGIALVANGTSTGNDFGDSTSQLAGVVFFDRNANGANDAGDAAISGVGLSITGLDATGAAVNRSTTTDASGNFAFDDLLAPNGAGYTLTETQPTAYSNGTITAGTAGGTVNQGSNLINAIALTAGNAAGNYRFAELGTLISGTVYRDSNRNSTQDVGEPGIANVTIDLLNASNANVATTTTASDGSYGFGTWPAASYTVVETQPTAYSSGPQTAGNSVTFALAAGTPQSVVFGESAGSFAGTVFLDSDNDGVQDVGEIGLPGVTVTLTGTDLNSAAVNRTATTNPSGNYTFADVLGGTYVITETQPAAFGDGQDVLGAGNAGGTAGNDVYSAITLTAGTQATGYNFGEIGSAVTGVVYRDANRNGTQNAGDTGIANVTITLKDAGNATVGTTTTASDGSYLFAGVAAGNHTVEETQPLGYGSSVSSPDSVAIVVPAGGAATASFADTLSTLAGSVFVDLDNDGVRDAGEPGISGVTIAIAGTDAAGGVVNRTAGTDASGNYIFIDLLTPNGTGYTVSQPTQPPLYADGLDAAGTSAGVVANDSISAIALAVNTDATGYTFGELGTTITGVVFKDSNANTTREGGEPGLPNVTLTLKNGIGTVVATTMTAGNGTYSFTALPSGNYTVDETQPLGYGSSTPNSRNITLPPGGSGTADFAEITSSIAGQVWSDGNNNGVRDGVEPGIAGVSVALTGTDAAGAAVNRTTTTNASGAFSFIDVLGGTYTLTETQPTAYADGIDVAGTSGGTVANDSISAIALAAGTDATGYGFGERGQSIAGRVWLDTDRDGVLDSTEVGISAVTITLRDNANAVVGTTTTNATGDYGFANIPAGHFTVDETQPAGYGSSTANSFPVDLVAGGTTPIVNFGETAGSFAGLAYNDTNNNALRDAGEPFIPNVTLRLTGTDARGNAVNVTTTSTDNGTYRFVDVVGGVYSITETQPTGYGDGLDAVGSAGGTLGNDVISAITLGNTVDATGYNFGERGADASITGTVWRDLNHDRMRSTDEDVLGEWIVELYQTNTLMQTVTTNASGVYQINGVAPGSGYEIRFREPISQAVYGKPVTNERGLTIVAHVAGTANPGRADIQGGTIVDLQLAPSARIEEQSLPVDPMGTIYDSVSRRTVAGATVTLTGPSGFNPATHLLGGAGNVTQITNAQGLYQYLLLSTAPAGTYTIAVTPPAGRYTPGVSVLIPPCAGPLNVTSLPNPALVQASDSAPPASTPNIDLADCATTSSQLANGLGTTQYFFDIVLTPTTSANLINNNIPVDPILAGALAMTKTTPSTNVSRGDLVPYTITVTNTLNALLTNVDVLDLIPPGFAYKSGTATVNGRVVEPQQLGRQLAWTDQSFTPRERKTYKLVLVVGAGVGEAEYINQAFGINNLIGATISNVATAAVRVVPDPVFDCSDLIGKVFDDRNVNGYQDDGEPGIANVRIATVNGVLVTTDAEGRYHVACAAIPNAYRGSNFVMKLDERTLPAGYRVTTENPRDVRLTRGKLTKLNFGATLHRVVRVEVSTDAFEPNSTQLRPKWRERIEQLSETLRDKPSVVRVAYSLGIEDEKLAARRKAALIKHIKSQWEALHCCYPLQVEDEAEVRQ